MLGALQRYFRVSDSLLVAMRDYMRDRQLLNETKEGSKSRKVQPQATGLAEGYILGHDLRNVSYDGLLRLDMSS